MGKAAGPSPCPRCRRAQPVVHPAWNGRPGDSELPLYRGFKTVAWFLSEATSKTHRGSSPARLSTGLYKPLLESRYDAKGFRIYFPRNGGPKDGDAVGHAIDTHAIFRIGGGLLQPEYGSVVRFFHVNETIGSRNILKCFEFLHGNFSLRLFTCGACQIIRVFARANAETTRYKILFHFGILVAQRRSACPGRWKISRSKRSRRPQFESGYPAIRSRIAIGALSGSTMA
jgi:hypothetical protein